MLQELDNVLKRFLLVVFHLKMLMCPPYSGALAMSMLKNKLKVKWREIKKFSKVVSGNVTTYIMMKANAH